MEVATTKRNYDSNEVPRDSIRAVLLDVPLDFQGFDSGKRDSFLDSLKRNSSQNSVQASKVSSISDAWPSSSRRSSSSRRAIWQFDDGEGFFLRMECASFWHWQGLQLWYMKRPQLRFLMYPYPSTETPEQWEQQMEVASSLTPSFPRAWYLRSQDKGGSQQLREMISIRGRVGWQHAFLEDESFQRAMSIVKNNKGRKERLEAAVKKEETEEGGQDGRWRQTYRSAGLGRTERWPSEGQELSHQARSSLSLERGRLEDHRPTSEGYSTGDRRAQDSCDGNGTSSRTSTAGSSGDSRSASPCQRTSFSVDKWRGILELSPRLLGTPVTRETSRPSSRRVISKSWTRTSSASRWRASAMHCRGLRDIGIRHQSFPPWPKQLLPSLVGVDSHEGAQSVRQPSARPGDGHERLVDTPSQHGDGRWAGLRNRHWAGW